MFRNLDNIATDLDILLVNLVMCSAKFNFSSIVMRKHFTALLTETGLLLISISIVLIGLLIWRGNINAENFLGLTVGLFVLVHSSTLRNS